MSLVEVTGGGYVTIFRLDEEEYARTGERRWIYENAISESRRARLAFRGAEMKPEYETKSEAYLYPQGGK